MSDYIIYGRAKPTPDALMQRMKPFCFTSYEAPDWELKLSTLSHSSAEEKRKHGGIDVFYSSYPSFHEYQPPAGIVNPQSIFHVISGSRRPRDCLLTGIVAGILASAYHGDVFDEEFNQILYRNPGMNTCESDLLEEIPIHHNNLEMSGPCERQLVTRLSEKYGLMKSVLWLKSLHMQSISRR